MYRRAWKMIKRSLRILTSLFVAFAFVACVNGEAKVRTIEETVDPDAYEQVLKEGEKWQKVTIRNNSDCLLAAVTIVEIQHPGPGVNILELVYANWFQVGDEEVIKVIAGRDYGIMIEGFYFNKSDPGKATGLAGQRYKHGTLSGKDEDEIIINCIHTLPKTATADEVATCPCGCGMKAGTCGCPSDIKRI
jgi:hypothetical protein